MKKFKFLLILMIISIFITYSCNEQNETSSVSFEEIEKEFNFQRPLSELSKINILKKFQSTENYRIFLINKLKNDSLNKNKIHDDLIKARKLGNKNF